MRGAKVEVRITKFEGRITKFEVRSAKCEVRKSKFEGRITKFEGRRLCRNDDVNVDENRLRIQISELPPDSKPSVLNLQSD